MDLYKYRVYCETESVWVETWAEEPVLVCPNNNGHTVTSGSITITEQNLDMGPQMADGRPLVRADTRPLETETYFTMAGDTVSGVGDGLPMTWNMDDDDDWEDIGDGMTRKIFKLTFNHEIYLKDGAIYFFNAPWGAWVDFYIAVPAGGYYPNQYGSIPASALGQPGDGMWEYAATDVLYQCYVNRHYMHGDCPMGDELNAEGAAINGLPVGWYLMGHIHAPATASGTGFKGYASIECYRERTIVLP